MRKYPLLIEPFNSTTSTARLLVGVSAFPILEVERRLGEIVKRVLGLRLCGDEGFLLLIVIRSLRLGFLLSLGSSWGGRSSGLLLLGRGDELDSLFCVFDLAEALLQLGVVDDRLEVTNEVGEFGTKGGVDGYPDSF